MDSLLLFFSLLMIVSPDIDTLILLLSAVSKTIFISLILIYGNDYLETAIGAIAFDRVTVLFYLIYLFPNRKRLMFSELNFYSKFLLSEARLIEGAGEINLGSAQQPNVFLLNRYRLSCSSTRAPRNIFTIPRLPSWQAYS